MNKYGLRRIKYKKNKFNRVNLTLTENFVIILTVIRREGIYEQEDLQEAILP